MRSRFSAVLTFFVFLVLYAPLAVMVVYSFRGPPGTPSEWSWRWYSKALSNAAVLDALEISCWVGVTSTVISTLLGTAAALALQRGAFPGKKTLDAIAHLPLIMPEIV